eukprot:m.240421 g.240421  ORF g.240421 m.240421 type:complete len:807 (+) comp13667_c0_seq1:1058-3478(+)
MQLSLRQQTEERLEIVDAGLGAPAFVRASILELAGCFLAKSIDRVVILGPLDDEAPAIQMRAPRDGLKRVARLLLRQEVNECKASVRAVGLGRHTDAADLAKRRKERADIALGGLERKIAHEQLGAEGHDGATRLARHGLGDLGRHLHLELVAIECRICQGLDRLQRISPANKLDESKAHGELLPSVLRVVLDGNVHAPQRADTGKYSGKVLLLGRKRKALDEHRALLAVALGLPGNFLHWGGLLLDGGRGGLGGLERLVGGPLKVEGLVVEAPVGKAAEGCPRGLRDAHFHQGDRVRRREDDPGHVAKLAEEIAQLVLGGVVRDVFHENHGVAAGGNLGVKHIQIDAVLAQELEILGDDVRLAQGHADRHAVRLGVQHVALVDPVGGRHCGRDRVRPHEESVPVVSATAGNTLLSLSLLLETCRDNSLALLACLGFCGQEMQQAALEDGAVELRVRIHSIRGHDICHICNRLRLLCLQVDDQRHLGEGPKALKESAQIGLGARVREVADKKPPGLSKGLVRHALGVGLAGRPIVRQCAVMRVRPQGLAGDLDEAPLHVVAVALERRSQVGLAAKVDEGTAGRAVLAIARHADRDGHDGEQEVGDAGLGGGERQAAQAGCDAGAVGLRVLMPLGGRAAIGAIIALVLAAFTLSRLDFARSRLRLPVLGRLCCRIAHACACALARALLAAHGLTLLRLVAVCIPVGLSVCVVHNLRPEIIHVRHAGVQCKLVALLSGRGSRLVRLGSANLLVLVVRAVPRGLGHNRLASPWAALGALGRQHGRVVRPRVCARARPHGVHKLGELRVC